MTRVDFYQLNAQQHDEGRIICQLCEKAYQSQQYTLLLTQGVGQSAHLNRLLWTFKEDSFIPHDEKESDAFKTPILIHNEPTPMGDRQLLINLTERIPNFFAEFERVIELVTDKNKQTAREHYSYYKERGYPLNHFTL